MSGRLAADDVLNRADRAALASLSEAVRDARASGDDLPAFTLIAVCLDELGVALPDRVSRTVSLEDAKEEWLRRLRTAGRSASTLSAYRVALDDLLAFLDQTDRRQSAFLEETIVAYLTDYRRRAQPAEATYYRRFMLLRRFFRWLSRRSGVPDPFLDLEPPGKPQQEADWLTAEEFARLLEAAGAPQRRRPGLAERDRLVLLTLAATGLRRSELLALDWSDLDLDGPSPSLLVRHGKGGKPRRQPLPPALARELARRRAAERAGLAKHVSAHTLRHTAATWLRQQTGDARLVAAYLGHADLSTVSRYAHVATDELHAAADEISARAGLEAALK